MGRALLLELILVNLLWNKAPVRTVALFVGQLTLSAAHRAHGHCWAPGTCLCLDVAVLALPSAQPCFGNQTQPPWRPAPYQGGAGIILHERASSGQESGVEYTIQSFDSLFEGIWGKSHAPTPSSSPPAQNSGSFNSF